MKAIGFDQIAGGTNVTSDTMASLINDGTSAGKTAMAAAMATASNANPQAQTVAGLVVDTGTKTATAVAGAATLSKNSGVVTTEALTTAAAAKYTLTLANTKISATDIVLVTVGNGTNSQGAPTVCQVTPGANSVVIVIQNVDAAQALNGTLKIGFVIVEG